MYKHIDTFLLICLVSINAATVFVFIFRKHYYPDELKGVTVLLVALYFILGLLYILHKL